MYWTKSKWLHLLCIALITLLGIKLIAPLEQYMDILFGDEATYLDIATKFFNKIDLSFGPLYALYYKLYLFFTNDKIFIYYLNFKVLSILLPILLYIFLVRLKYTWQTSLFIALSLLISAINITCWPKISHFTLVIILLFLIASTYLKNTTQKIIILTVGTFIIAYSRPEFFLVFYILIIWCIYLLIKNKSKQNSFLFISASIFFCFVLLTLGFPSEDVLMPNGVLIKRSYVAIVQHYYLSEQLRGIQHDFNFLSAYDYYYNRTFADANGSVLKLFTHHFPLMLKHILVNIAFYALQFLSKLATIINPVFIKMGKKFILSTVLVILAIVFSIYKNKDFKVWIKSFLQENKTELIYIILFLIPTTIACLLMMPREHYIVLQLLFITIIAAILIEAIVLKFKYASYILLIAIIIISFFRQLSDYTFVQVDSSKNNINVKLIKELQHIANEKDTIFMFTDLLNSSAFIDNAKEPKVVEYSYYYHNYNNFYDYIFHKPYNLIIYSKTMEQEPILRNDSTWHSFLNNPSALNFKEYKSNNLGNDTYRIFIKDK
ncbi:MAG: hypothetical protein H6553_05875 [Chitinophagales bacterium]|nr:hypothetical protein [Chitinophagales bacterium]